MEWIEAVCGLRRGCFFVVVLLLILLAFSATLPADTLQARPQVKIPRLDKPPKLEDFLDMRPSGAVGEQMVKIEGFIQREPSDGAPASQPTEAYLGYDDKNLYIVMVAFDSDPSKIRARMARRENAFGDDFLEVTLDTFHDQRRGFLFWVNPLGIQADALWSEGRGPDFSFDTLWYSKGKLTEKGYVVWMAIPFKSLRFKPGDAQTWGIVLLRNVPRLNESSFWPHVSSRVEGRLNQAGTISVEQSISPGRNIQLIPYAGFRSFRALDRRDPNQPRFLQKDGEFDAGLDAKVVLKDSLALDVTVNPDFSQVESDNPQITANQRFEVFFPEKRPFFLENANFFRTPLNLVFTRRIADPQFGARLTGKAGPYALGAMIIDDQSPGRSVLPGDPLRGTRARYSIFRVNRDLFGQSNLGAIYTEREFEGSYNRVGGVDGRLKFGQNWTATFQGVTSATRNLAGEKEAGPAYRSRVVRNGRQLTFNFNYTDVGRGFVTQPGFINRRDIRAVTYFTSYRFRPEGAFLISWGPSFWNTRKWDHTGTRLEWAILPSFRFDFIGQTNFEIVYRAGEERFRPEDFSGLTENRSFYKIRPGIFFETGYFKQVTIEGDYRWGTEINFSPAAGGEPILADQTKASLEATVRPISPLKIENTYILFQLRDRSTGANIFSNHIVRSNWNWQFNRELSLRFILQYDALLRNPALTDLTPRRNVNADFLITYLINPGTALFVGYNTNAQNFDLAPNPAGGRDIVQTGNRFINDARQFFVKFSYLYRF